MIKKADNTTLPYYYCRECSQTLPNRKSASTAFHCGLGDEPKELSSKENTSEVTTLWCHTNLFLLLLLFDKHWAPRPHSPWGMAPLAVTVYTDSVVAAAWNQPIAELFSLASGAFAHPSAPLRSGRQTKVWLAATHNMDTARPAVWRDQCKQPSLGPLG